MILSFGSITVEKNRLCIDENKIINSYIAAGIADFIRQNLLKSEYSFSYETVMSDPKKYHF